MDTPTTPHDRILSLITSDYAWEQVLSQIVATEGLDPWDVDLRVLSEAFLKIVSELRQMDFSIPAKYVMIATVLLRMKSDRLPVLPSEDEGDPMFNLPDQLPEANGHSLRATVSPLEMQPTRLTRRKVMLSELIDALRKAIRTDTRRTERRLAAREQIQIKEDDTTHRIDGLYQRINALLAKVKGEIPFSQLVEKWDRDGVANTFLPLIYLDHFQHISCRQEDIFQEIYVKPGPCHGLPLPIPGQALPEQKEKALEAAGNKKVADLMD